MAAASGRRRWPTEYDLHLLLGKPRQLWMRRKERHRESLAIAFLEASRYRKAAYDFIAARMEDPGLMYNFDLTEGDLAVDVGAFEGRWSREVAARTPCRIDAFELSPEFFEGLHEVAESIDAMRVFEYGLGGDNETVLISRSHLGSSVFDTSRTRMGAEWLEGTLRDIAEVWQELGWDRVAVLKLNIEGGEYDLLDRLIATGLISQVECVFVQFHEWIPDAYPRRRKIRRALLDTHELQWSYDWVWEKWQLKG